MIIKQLTIFLENKSGRLSEATKVLGDNGINISALSIADTSEYGLLRLIVSDGEKAVELLKQEGFSVSLTNVICLKVEHRPGTLHDAIAALSQSGVDVEYMYAYVAGNHASVIMKVSDCQKAIDTLKKENIDILEAKEVYHNCQ